MLPPKIWRPTGRPRNERIHLGGEVKCTRCCGRCGDYGHNRKICKRPIPLHPRDEHSCVNIVESNINIQEFSLQPVVLSHFNNVTTKFVFWGGFSYVSTLFFI